jgi:hypothetical protein
MQVLRVQQVRREQVRLVRRVPRAIRVSQEPRVLMALRVRLVPQARRVRRVTTVLPVSRDLRVIVVTMVAV